MTDGDLQPRRPSRSSPYRHDAGAVARLTAPPLRASTQPIDRAPTAGRPVATHTVTVAVDARAIGDRLTTDCFSIAGRQPVDCRPTPDRPSADRRATPAKQSTAGRPAGDQRPTADRLLVDSHSAVDAAGRQAVDRRSTGGPHHRSTCGRRRRSTGAVDQRSTARRPPTDRGEGD